MRKKTILKFSKKPKQKVKIKKKTPSENSPTKTINKETASTNINNSTKTSYKTSGDYGSRGVRGDIRLEQTITIKQKTVIRQLAPFAESCLPKTMQIAIDSRHLLFPLLNSYPSSWSFIDKIFAMVAPIFESDIAKFYAKKGTCMAEMYSSLQIERFDKIVSRDLLEKIKAIKIKKGIKL